MRVRVHSHDCPVTFAQPDRMQCTCGRLWVFYPDARGWQCVVIVIDGHAYTMHEIEEALSDH